VGRQTGPGRAEVVLPARPILRMMRRLVLPSRKPSGELLGVQLFGVLHDPVLASAFAYVYEAVQVIWPGSFVALVIS
jgi:hypothetical protein